jgi:hypothetical protein
MLRIAHRVVLLRGHIIHEYWVTFLNPRKECKIIKLLLDERDMLMNSLLNQRVSLLVIFHQHLQRCEWYPQICSEFLGVREFSTGHFRLLLLLLLRVFLLDHLRSILNQPLLYKDVNCIYTKNLT